jgi:hypothetical protein
LDVKDVTLMPVKKLLLFVAVMGPKNVEEPVTVRLVNVMFPTTAKFPPTLTLFVVLKFPFTVTEVPIVAPPAKFKFMVGPFIVKLPPPKALMP